MGLLCAYHAGSMGFGWVLIAGSCNQQTSGVTLPLLYHCSTTALPTLKEWEADTE